MLLLNENSYKCLAENFANIILCDDIIVELYQIAKKFDDDLICKCYYSLPAFIDIMRDDWLLKKWEEMSSSDLSIVEKAELIRTEVVRYLKDCIIDDIAYE